jgi:hypothetical protein
VFLLDRADLNNEISSPALRKKGFDRKEDTSEYSFFGLCKKLDEKKKGESLSESVEGLTWILGKLPTNGEGQLS